MKEKIMAVLDVLFILILCFAVLLATMLVTASANTENFCGYRIDFVKLACTILLVGSYLFVMVQNSTKRFKDFLRYGSEKEEPDESNSDV